MLLGRSESSDQRESTVGRTGLTHSRSTAIPGVCKVAIEGKKGKKVSYSCTSVAKRETIEREFLEYLPHEKGG